MNPSPASDAELSAYVDGEAPPARRAMIEAWMANTPAATARVAAFRRQNDALRAQFGVIAQSQEQSRPQPPVNFATRAYRPSAAEPMRQIARVERIREEQRGRLVLVTAGSFLAGAAVALVAATFLGFAPAFLEGARIITARPIEAIFINDPVQTAFARALATHRVFALDPTKPVEFEETGDALAQRLSQRAGLRIEAPDLSAKGLKLLGGRIIPGELGTAGLLVYEARNGERFGLLVSHAIGLAIATPRYAEASITVVLWTQGDRSFALTGRGESALFGEIIAQIRAQFTKNGAQ